MGLHLGSLRLAAWTIVPLLLLGCSSGKVSSGDPGNYAAGATGNGTAGGTCHVDADCDDHNYCNGESSCEGGFCRRGERVDCDDDVDCTHDTCDEAADRCQNTPNHTLCAEGEVCDVEQGCRANVPCEDDGNVCNGVETCDAQGRLVPGDDVPCDDGNDCTVDACSEEDGCTHLLPDEDGDGHGDAACRGGSDCNDDDESVNPGAREICTDGVDNDCDRDRDCDDAQCANSAQCERNQDRDRADRDDDDRDVDRDRDDRDRNRQDRRGNDRDPCIVNDWYDDGHCDDVCLRRDGDCGANGRGRDDGRWGRDQGWGRERDNRRRNDDRDARDDRRRGADQRAGAGECGRTTTAGRCEGDKVLLRCTGTGRNERLVRSTCSGSDVCSVRNGLAECVSSSNRSVPAGWTCNATYYGTRDGCDCGCGIVDPDCSVASQQVYGCDPGQACGANGLCGTRSSRVPAGWTCTAAYYGTRDGCDCNCGGVRDPDCDVAGQQVYRCETGQVCGANGLCTNGRAGTPGGPPAGWNEALCSATYYNDDNGCDCECGAFDPDCNAGPDTNEGRVIGCVDNQVCSAAGRCVYQESRAPAGWNTTVCEATWYGTDDGCDCGCGAIDPDCEDGGGCTAPGCADDACGFCHGGNTDGTCRAADDADIPANWTCNRTWYLDEYCDCDCGATDPDCATDECSRVEVPAGWTCSDLYYYDERCDCDCGVHDLDCGVDECDDEGGEGEDPDDENVAVPAGWTCNELWYYDGECDCICGVADDRDCTYNECDDDDEDANVDDDEVSVPAGWTCPDNYYGDDWCDCDCGADDLGCSWNECSGVEEEEEEEPYTPYGWTCQADYYGDDFCDCDCGADDVDCGYDECSAQNVDDDTGGYAPNGWTCPDDYYGDDLCDCDCGAVDSDCGYDECGEYV